MAPMMLSDNKVRVREALFNRARLCAIGGREEGLKNANLSLLAQHLSFVLYLDPYRIKKLADTDLDLGALPLRQ